MGSLMSPEIFSLSLSFLTQTIQGSRGSLSHINPLALDTFLLCFSRVGDPTCLRPCVEGTLLLQGVVGS